MYPLTKNAKMGQKINLYLKVMGIISIGRKLLKTVGLLAVRLGLAELRLKNHQKMYNFDQNLNPKNNRCTLLEKMRKWVKK